MAIKHSAYLPAREFLSWELWCEMFRCFYIYTATSENNRDTYRIILTHSISIIRFYKVHKWVPITENDYKKLIHCGLLRCKSRLMIFLKLDRITCTSLYPFHPGFSEYEEDLSFRVFNATDSLDCLAHEVYNTFHVLFMFWTVLCSYQKRAALNDTLIGLHSSTRERGYWWVCHLY